MFSPEVSVPDDKQAIAGMGHPQGDRAPLRILVVEDNMDMRDFLRRILVRRGYVLLEAADGAEGLDLARTQRPDLILMDLSLPNLDGLEATRQLKSDPELKHIPIVAVTAHARSSDEERAREAGCDDYISKPYSLSEFLGVIESHMSKVGS